MVKKHKEAIELYEAGMGLALNADAARARRDPRRRAERGVDFTIRGARGDALSMASWKKASSTSTRAKKAC
jgi:hypothetical protein